jgi:hypothetical protein
MCVQSNKCTADAVHAARLGFFVEYRKQKGQASISGNPPCGAKFRPAAYLLTYNELLLMSLPICWKNANSEALSEALV